MSESLTDKRCVPCEGGIPPMPEAEIRTWMKEIPGWELAGAEIARTFEFEDFHRTMAFVNAVAWIAHHEDHHPDLEVGYRACKVRYRTHAIGGISENDFICAAKINALLGP